MSGTLLCPLCDYDLRGLTNPRCPECGYSFTWEDLTDPERKRHPYLFEHHPRRNVWSFVRTMAGGLRPRRFWTSLKPSQPSKPSRLLLYWLLSGLIVPAGYAAVFARTCVQNVKVTQAERARMLGWATSFYNAYANAPSGPDGTLYDIRAAGGPQKWVDEIRPPPDSPGYLAYIYRQSYAGPFEQHLEAILIYALWPWLTLLVLMIFRVSMRRAKVNTVHVLRCVLYSCDAAWLLGAAAILLVPPIAFRLDLGRYIGFRDAAVSSVLFAIFTGWRLSAAYRHYLQFHRPAATAAASQVVVLLAVWVYLMGRALEAI